MVAYKRWSGWMWEESKKSVCVSVTENLNKQTTNWNLATEQYFTVNTRLYYVPIGAEMFQVR